MCNELDAGEQYGLISIVGVLYTTGLNYYYYYYMTVAL